jgi:hypothetical protein
MKLQDFLHRTCLIIPLLNSITVCGARGPQPCPVPCDFWLFPRLKEMLAGYLFESCCGIGSAVYQCLQYVPKEEYWAAFRKWVDQCKMCVEANGAYFEGLR